MQRVILYLTAAVLLGGRGLWWYCDEVRGIRWAQAVVRDRFPDVPALATAELQEWLEDPGRPRPQILDARTPEERRVSQLPGAVGVDPAADGDRILEQLDPSRSVVVYCAGGYRGARLARRLIQSGAKEVYNLDGGIFAWGNEERPLQCDGNSTQLVHPHLFLFDRMLKHPATQPQR
jgi:rhodanese-related sulfurtransferase